MLEYIVLIPIGFFIATFASLVGIGGGLLWAPYLILIKGMHPQKAVLISFMIQFVGMGSATFRNIRNKTIFWRLALTLIPFITIGVVLGAFLNQRVARANYLEIGLGILSIIVTLFFTFQVEKYDEHLNLDTSIKSPFWLKLQGACFGTISGLFSIGIGDFLIPVMRSRLKIPMRYAIGTSLFLNFAISFLGAVFHFVISSHTLDAEIMNILIFSWIGVILGGQIGPKLSSIVGDHRLKEIFIFALMLIGIHLIFQSL